MSSKVFEDVSILGTLTHIGTTTTTGQLNIDNIRLDGNTISITDTDGLLNLTANGTGKVTIPTGNELNIVDAGGFYYAGTSVTSTAAELNYLDLTTGPGTQEASKAVVADANVNTGISKITELHIGASGSETQVTSTAAELNILDGATLDVNELNFLDGSTAGTAVASKALVVDADKDIAGLRSVGANNIAFPATQVPSADPNTLDDYEEGTFTPELADASTGGNTATGNLSGSYVKIGRVVHFVMRLDNIDTTGMTAGNDMYIRDLPFTSAALMSGIGYPSAVILSNVTFSGTPVLFVESGTARARIGEISSASAIDQIMVSEFASGSADVYATGTYLV